MTLQQRLTLNDKEQEDLTIVKTLKYLQDKGMIDGSGPCTQPDPSADAVASNAQTSSKTSSHPHLPPAPVKKEGINSLPAIPPTSTLPSKAPTVKYNGWNLSGFGNTGVKSGDL
jgi:hypothetical protein